MSILHSATTPLENDVGHVLEMTAHSDSLYSYYYSDNNTNKIQVTEIFDIEDITKHELCTDLEVYNRAAEDLPVAHQTCNPEWDGIKAGKLNLIFIKFIS